MATALLSALAELLKLGRLGMEERHRYEDNILRLKKEYYEEFSKLETEIGSDNRLDDLDLELRLLSEALIETIRAKNP